MKLTVGDKICYIPILRILTTKQTTTMDQVLTPHRYMMPRSETMLSPPPLKRPRKHDEMDILQDMVPTSIPMSLMIPDNLDTPDLPGDLWQDQESIPRITLKRRTVLSPSSTPILKRKTGTTIPSPASDFLLLSKPTDTPPMRMKRRRSSISSCGADTYGRFEVTPLMPFV